MYYVAGDLLLVRAFEILACEGHPGLKLSELTQKLGLLTPVLEAGLLRDLRRSPDILMMLEADQGFRVFRPSKDLFSLDLYVDLTLEKRLQGLPCLQMYPELRTSYTLKGLVHEVSRAGYQGLWGIQLLRKLEVEMAADQIWDNLQWLADRQILMRIWMAPSADVRPAFCVHTRQLQASWYVLRKFYRESHFQAEQRRGQLVQLCPPGNQCVTHPEDLETKFGRANQRFPGVWDGLWGPLLFFRDYQGVWPVAARAQPSLHVLAARYPVFQRAIQLHSPGYSAAGLVEVLGLHSSEVDHYWEYSLYVDSGNPVVLGPGPRLRGASSGTSLAARNSAYAQILAHLWPLVAGGAWESARHFISVSNCLEGFQPWQLAFGLALLGSHLRTEPEVSRTKLRTLLSRRWHRPVEVLEFRQLLDYLARVSGGVPQVDGCPVSPGKSHKSNLYGVRESYGFIRGIMTRTRFFHQFCLDLCAELGRFELTLQEILENMDLKVYLQVVGLNYRLGFVDVYLHSPDPVPLFLNLSSEERELLTNWRVPLRLTKLADILKLMEVLDTNPSATSHQMSFRFHSTLHEYELLNSISFGAYWSDRKREFLESSKFGGLGQLFSWEMPSIIWTSKRELGVWDNLRKALHPSELTFENSHFVQGCRDSQMCPEAAMALVKQRFLGSQEKKTNRVPSVSKRKAPGSGRRTSAFPSLTHNLVKAGLLSYPDHLDIGWELAFQGFEVEDVQQSLAHYLAKHLLALRTVSRRSRQRTPPEQLDLGHYCLGHQACHKLYGSLSANLNFRKSLLHHWGPISGDFQVFPWETPKEAAIDPQYGLAMYAQRRLNFQVQCHPESYALAQNFSLTSHHGLRRQGNPGPRLDEDEEEASLLKRTGRLSFGDHIRETTGQYPVIQRIHGHVNLESPNSERLLFLHHLFGLKSRDSVNVNILEDVENLSYVFDYLDLTNPKHRMKDVSMNLVPPGDPFEQVFGLSRENYWDLSGENRFKQLGYWFLKGSRDFGDLVGDLSDILGFLQTSPPGCFTDLESYCDSKGIPPQMIHAGVFLRLWTLIPWGDTYRVSRPSEAQPLLDRSSSELPAYLDFRWFWMWLRENPQFFGSFAEIYGGRPLIEDLQESFLMLRYLLKAEQQVDVLPAHKFVPSGFHLLSGGPNLVCLCAVLQHLVIRLNQQYGCSLLDIHLMLGEVLDLCEVQSLAQSLCTISLAEEREGLYYARSFTSF